MFFVLFFSKGRKKKIGGLRLYFLDKFKKNRERESEEEVGTELGSIMEMGCDVLQQEV